MTETNFATIDISTFQKSPFPSDVDFPSSEQRRIASNINQAFTLDGAFILRNFGMSDNAKCVKHLFEEAQTLFSMSSSEKATNLSPIQRSNGNVGYIGPDSEMLNRSRGMSAESKESFNFRFGTNDTNVHCFKGCSPQFKKAAHEFWMMITEKCVPVISLAFSIALDLPYDYFINLIQECEGSTFRTLHYPPLAQSPPGLKIRAGEHTDFGFFTLLFTTKPGLQVQPVAGGELENGNIGNESCWSDVPVPAFGDTIVNAGGMMARLTNDIWQAAAHRVIESDLNINGRYSIACFIEPEVDLLIETHDKFLEKGDKKCRKYDSITAGEYLNRRLHDLKPVK